MKLARIGDTGQERPVAVISDTEAVDLTSVIDDVGPSVFDHLEAIRTATSAGSLPVISLDGVRFGPPLRGIGKIVCVGLNYANHARETGAEIPVEPVLFMKAPDTVCGANDDVSIPPGSTATDYEVELAVVIGRTARYLGDDDDPFGFIGGYCISNDVSERDFQLLRSGQWDKGKNCETFNPFGPLLVTSDDADPSDLRLTTTVNGVTKQSESTADMVVGAGELVRYISQFMVLYPGDVINTGTPAGVALGHPDPKPYLKPGDVVELSITGLGAQRQRFVAATAANGRRA
jgi:2-keto-4-pentenoate hydratase/2-oxohepta-3-ene-1,7-dioic acid hydratase in catechol pathway